MNAVVSEFPGVQNKCYYFHLAQPTYRRVEAADLKKLYCTDLNFNLAIRHLPALVF